MEEKVGAQERRDMVALALLCRDGTDGSAAAGLRRGGGVLDGMVSLCSRTGCRYMRNPAYGSAVAGTAERARAETLSGTSEACLCASLGNEKAAENSGFFIIGAQDETRTHTP